MSIRGHHKAMKNPIEIILVLAILAVMGIAAWQLFFIKEVETVSVFTKEEPVEEVVSKTDKFQMALEQKVITEIGQPIEGFEPAMFMQVFPGLEASDFDGVEAAIGRYEYDGFELKHDLGEVEMIHSAAQAVTEDGIETLFTNVAYRLHVKLSDIDVAEVINGLGYENKTIESPVQDELVACTMDAKICPDGSAVGRTGPDCEFSACQDFESGGPEEVFICSAEEKEAEICTAIYSPVCGAVEVQCVTTPCYPVQKTFSSSCNACANGNVEEYTTGECLLVN